MIDVQLAVHLFDNEGKTYRQIAEILSSPANPLSKDAVRSAIRRYKERTVDTSASALGLSYQPTIPKHLQLKSDRVAVCADIHVPFHSQTFFHKFFAMLNLFNVTDVVIAGDLTNQDQHSMFPRTAPNNPTFHDELVAAGDLLVALDTVLRRIGERTGARPRLVITSGNHDEVASKRLSTDFRLEGLVYYMLKGRQLTSELLVTEYDFVDFDVSGQPWTFGHASSYNRRPGQVAMNLATKLKRNVAVGHDHIIGFTSTVDNEYLALSVGSMIHVDQDGRSALWYKERRLSTYSKIRQGFLILVDGAPYLFEENGTSVLNGKQPWSYWENKMVRG